MSPIECVKFPILSTVLFENVQFLFGRSFSLKADSMCTTIMTTLSDSKCFCRTVTTRVDVITLEAHSLSYARHFTSHMIHIEI